VCGRDPTGDKIHILGGDRMKKIHELKQRMVNVREDLWYEITDYMTDVEGNITEVQGDNGQWYSVDKVKGII
jgi:hypothetical protein